MCPWKCYISVLLGEFICSQALHHVPSAERIMAIESGFYIHKERSTYAFINLENILFALSDNQMC